MEDCSNTVEAGVTSNIYLISPACILSFLITATVRGELKNAWAWSDDPEKVQENTRAIPPNDAAKADSKVGEIPSNATARVDDTADKTK